MIIYGQNKEFICLKIVQKQNLKFTKIFVKSKGDHLLTLVECKHTFTTFFPFFIFCWMSECQNVICKMKVFSIFM